MSASPFGYAPMPPTQPVSEGWPGLDPMPILQSQVGAVHSLMMFYVVICYVNDTWLLGSHGDGWIVV